MTTFDRLQELSDGEFHRLCDDLLRRVESRYRRLRTHGLNPDGVSIKGQPDSYVGETAATCTIAFQYSVDKGDWWNKIIGDVREAVKISPGVQEIVVATPRNLDRDGPKDRTVDWLSQAKAEAGRATLQPPYDGRDIARLLDDDHQDLRYEHLQIPYSRLSGQSILASCQKANAQAIEELKACGRYDPARYATREADSHLFELWQRALRPTDMGGSSSRGPGRLIALVNDSGVGKTSLLATFVRSLGTTLPALLLQARNLAFTPDDSLVTYVVQAMQGVLDCVSRNTEEAAIVHHLAGGFPLVVVLDGLDEAKDACSVRRAINYWLKSNVGQMSILVVSSRPEFWKICVDRGWRAWMPSADRDDHKASMVASGWSVELTDPTDGFPLPDRFTAEELETAWIRAGQPLERFFLLPSETREELRHPFTLRVYLDLLETGDIPLQPTRVDLLRAWLERRLAREVNPAERLTQEQFRQALITIATKLAELGGGSLSVDDLDGVPRFDGTHPPGPVVEQLLAANILESVPGQPDRIRFSVEAVQDFYRAEAEMAEIERAPDESAEMFAGLSFTKAYPRLARIGQLLLTSEARHQFVASLATADARKAAIVLRGEPSKFHRSVRQAVVDALGQQINARHRVRGAFAIHLLGDLDCEESRQCLVSHLLPPAKPHVYLREFAAKSFIKLGIIEGVGLVYGSSRFGYYKTGLAYYFKEMLAAIRHADPSFRTALAEYAVQRLKTAQDDEHGRAVCVLAYLGDKRLVPHLESRLKETNALLEYENHALFALGTEEAATVFVGSAKATIERISKLGNDDRGIEHFQWNMRISCHSADFPYLCTAAFEQHIASLMRDDDENVAHFGCVLALRSDSSSLLYDALCTYARRKWILPSRSEIGTRILPDAWLAWWRDSTGESDRAILLRFLPVIPNPELEHVLIDCLGNPPFTSAAAGALGRFHCYRAAAFLRQIVDRSDATDWDKAQAADALGDLRDESSVGAIRTFLAEHSNRNAKEYAVSALGFIGTIEAENALTALLNTEVDEQAVAAALICSGGQSAVSKVVTLARLRHNAKWLCECIQKAFWFRGWYAGKYYRHVYTAELVEYLAAEEPTMAPDDKWFITFALQQIDSDEIRQMLRQWAARIGTPADTVLRENDGLKLSAICYDELMQRGDSFNIPYFLALRADEPDRFFVRAALGNLSHFDSERVAAELRQRFEDIRENSQAVRLTWLLARFGSPKDDSMIRPFLDHADDLVANVAYESLLRLTDPMAVPENWGEM